MGQRFRWGHINVNVTDLDRSIVFYRELGFEMFRPDIPYLGLEAAQSSTVSQGVAQALAVPQNVQGRACIMQLGKGLPKLDLTEFASQDPHLPLQNQDLGLVRLCLVSEDLQADYQQLVRRGVEFLAPPSVCTDRMAEVAICKDPDGTLIELLQVDLDRWPRAPQPAQPKNNRDSSNIIHPSRR